MKEQRGKPRIFVGPVEVAGYYMNLVAGLRGQGFRVDYVTFQEHRFGYEQDATRWNKIFARISDDNQKPVAVTALSRYPVLLLRLLLQWTAFVFFAIKCKVFIFSFGQSFLPHNLDLPVLRVLQKRIIVNIGHGSEARPPFCSGAFQSFDGAIQPTVSFLAKKTAQTKRRVSRIERWAHVVIGAPYSSTQFAVRRQINWFHVGVPCAIPVVNSRSRSSDAKFAITHSPSHPALKGSTCIREVIEHLQRKGYPIEYRELINCSHSEVMQQLACSDLVIDQLYSDTPLAGLATEAAWFGVPSVVCGYGLTHLASHVAQEMWPPSIISEPSQLFDTVKELLDNPESIEKAGRNVKEFVKRHWSLEQVATRYESIIYGQVPERWFMDPAKVRYLHGCGQSEAQTRSVIKELVNSYGRRSLCLEHKPDLEHAYLQFARPQ